MSKQLSQYLDLLRVTAALLVLLAHLADHITIGTTIEIPNQLGYSSVMVFFVLSGYVISYVAAERELTLSYFAISRIARVYSVVVPAIALTIFVDILFLNIPPAFNASKFMESIPLYQYAKFPKYLLMDLTFANQIWLMTETAFTNGAYWSMCFEVYYYILFAAAFYFTGIRRVALIILIVLIVGPFSLLRFHLWLFGYAAYRLHRDCEMSVAASRFLFAITGVLMIVDLATNLNLRIDEELDLLTNGLVSHSFLRRLVGDTLTAAIIALNIFAAKYTSFTLGRFGPCVTYLASFSFSLYLMHVPLIRFWSAYWLTDPFAVAILVLASVWLLGKVTEKQKDHIRNILRRGFAHRFWWHGSSGR